jgi:hypothetical protein
MTDNTPSREDLAEVRLRMLLTEATARAERAEARAERAEERVYLIALFRRDRTEESS